DAEYAADNLLQPHQELVEDGKVEPIERAQPVDIRLAGAGRYHHRDRITRDHPKQDEDHQRHAEQCRRDEEQTTNNGTAAHSRSVGRNRSGRKEPWTFSRTSAAGPSSAQPHVVDRRNTAGTDGGAPTSTVRAAGPFRPTTALRRRDGLRQKHAVALRGQLQAFAHDDRLDVLQERDDLAL